MNRAVLRAAMRDMKAEARLAEFPRCAVHPRQIVLAGRCALCEPRAEQPTTEERAEAYRARNLVRVDLTPVKK